MADLKTKIAFWIIDTVFSGLLDEISSQIDAGEGPYHDYLAAKLATSPV